MIGERIATARRVDWWPFTRLLVTALVIGLGAQVFLGWQVRPRELLALTWQMFGVLSILAMISFVLADIYLLSFLVPLYLLGVLNDWFYDLSVAVCRVVLRPRSARAVALAGLCGELALFGLCLLAIGRLAARL